MQDWNKKAELYAGSACQHCEETKMTAAVQICSLLLDIEETSALPLKKIWNAEKLPQGITLNATQNIQDILL